VWGIAVVDDEIMPGFAGRGVEDRLLVTTWRGELDKKKLRRESQGMNIWQYSAQETDGGQKYCMKYCMRNTAQKPLRLWA